MLSAIGQGSIAHAEFRRFLELLFWTIYFTDHSAEWAEFQKAKNGGFSRDQHKPISFAANRELGYYVDYTAELMENDPSGLGSQSVAALRTVIHELNSNVHAGQIAKEQRKLVPYENPDSVYLSKFVRLQRSVFSSSCIVLAAYKRQNLKDCRLPQEQTSTGLLVLFFVERSGQGRSEIHDAFPSQKYIVEYAEAN